MTPDPADRRVQPDPRRTAYRRLGSTPQPRRRAASSSALALFLKRAPDCPFTRPSHSAQVRCRIGIPPTTLMYEWAGVFAFDEDVVPAVRLGSAVSSGS